MTSFKIRNVRKEDVNNIKAVIDSSELFPSELIDDMIAGYFSGTEESIWLTADQEAPSFVAFCAPEKMTEGTWNLYLIAVHAHFQGSGVGGQVLEYLENRLTTRNARVLIVETSGLPEFEKTRAFYRKYHYTEEATIRDFYQEGEDKVVFWKKLTKIKP